MTAILINSDSYFSPPELRASPIETKTFIEHCNDQLQPEVIESLKRKALLHKVAAAATFVAYTVLAVSAFVATGILAPAYLPIAGICAMLFANKFVQYAQDHLNAGKQCSASAKQLNEIKRHYEALASATAPELHAKFTEMGLNVATYPHLLQQPEVFKPLIARHEFWKNYRTALEQKKQTKCQEARELGTQNFLKNRLEIYRKHTEALDLDRRILEAKVKQAFIIAVIRYPAMRGTFESHFEFSRLANHERVISNALGDINDAFYAFKHSTSPTRYESIETVRGHDPHYLSTQLLHSFPQNADHSSNT